MGDLYRVNSADRYMEFKKLKNTIVSVLKYMHKNMNNNSKLPKILLAIYVVLFIILGIAPVERGTWLVENLTVIAVVAPLVILYAKKIRFSNTSYVLMMIFIIMHTIGGHYTFANVPFDWFTNFFGFERNHYDRIAHFSVGFYAYPISEILMARGLIAKRWLALLFGIFTIMAVAAAYEIFEWQYAILTDPSAGNAILGSQGDNWDAQEDMLADTLGALVAVAYAVARGWWGKNKT